MVGVSIIIMYVTLWNIVNTTVYFYRTGVSTYSSYYSVPNICILTTKNTFLKITPPNVCY